MATFEEFANMDTVECCVSEQRKNEIKNMCSTCEIANCTSSYLYKAAATFWHSYHKEQDWSELMSKVKANKPPPTRIVREGFVRLDKKGKIIK